MAGRQFEKGHAKKGGRVKGTPNKTTKEHRDRINAFFESHWDEFENEIWQELTAKEKKDTFVALINYKYPKLSSVDVKAEHKTDASALEMVEKMVGDSNIIKL